MVQTVSVELRHQNQIRNVLVLESQIPELEVQSCKSYFSSSRRYFGNNSAMNKFKISAEMGTFLEAQKRLSISGDESAFSFSSLSRNICPFSFRARINMLNRATYSRKKSRWQN